MFRKYTCNFFFDNLFTFVLFSVPEEVDDEAAALTQFKTKFSERYFDENVGPGFSTKTFQEVINEATKGTCRKPLGSKTAYMFF